MAVDVQANQEIDIVESSLNKELDEFQSKIDENCDILQQVREELMQEPVEAPEELPAEEAGGGRGKGAGEEHQRLTLHPIPINLDPSVTAQPKNNPLPVNILPTFEPHATPETPTAKVTQFAMSALQNFKTLVATVQAYATTSKTLAVAYVEWHSGWFGCWFGFGAPEPRHIHKLHQLQQPPKA